MTTNGNSHWLASEAGQQLQGTLSNEQTLHTLNRLLSRLDRYEHMMDRMESWMQQGPGMMSMITDVADDSIRAASDRGVDIESRMGYVFQLLETLTAPETVKKLEGAVALADQLPGLVSMFTDIVDEGVHQAGERGVHIESRIQNALAAAEKLTSPEIVKQLDTLVQLVNQAPGLIAMTVDMIDEGHQQLMERGGGVDPEALQILVKMGNAISQAKDQPIEKRGPWGLLMASRHPDLQKAFGFLINFGKNFGKQLSSHTHTNG